MPKPTPGKQYTIADENTLSRVASRAYGNAAHWPRIWRANQSALRSGNPDIIFPGEVIYIPEIGELLRDDPGISNREPDELSIVIDGLEIRSTASRVALTMDTVSDGWTASMNWIPGDNPELDKRLLPYSYPPVKIYIGGILEISGYLYTVGSALSEKGTVINLAGFSRTADMIDSNVQPPYEENNVTLKQRAIKLIEPHGLKAVFETDTGGQFDRVTASETERVIQHLNKLAFQRGVLISSTPDGNPLFWNANVDAAPVATIEEGKQIALEFSATFDGRKRFHSYRAISNTPFDPIDKTVHDNKVPRSRVKTFRVEDSLSGELELAAKWERNRTLADALTIPIPVVGWLNERTGKAWEPNTKVTVVAPSIHIPNGFDFLIRSVEFSETAKEKTAILNIVPPQVYTKGEIIEPWG